MTLYNLHRNIVLPAISPTNLYDTPTRPAPPVSSAGLNMTVVRDFVIPAYSSHLGVVFHNMPESGEPSRLGKTNVGFAPG